MNTNSTITINTGKTTIKIIPDSDNGKATILQVSYTFLELLATVFVTFEKVEAGAAWT